MSARRTREQHVVTCAVNALGEVTAALSKKFGEPAAAKFVWRPQTHITIEGDGADTLMKLLTQLDDLDDVQDVYSNEEMSEAELARLSS